MAFIEALGALAESGGAEAAAGEATASEAGASESVMNKLAPEQFAQHQGGSKRHPVPEVGGDPRDFNDPGYVS